MQLINILLRIKNYNGFGRFAQGSYDFVVVGVADQDLTAGLAATRCRIRIT